MGYDTYWTEESADLTHLSDEEWAALTAALLEHLPDHAEADAGPGTDLTFGAPFFRWAADAATDPSQRVIYFGESESRIQHDDVCLGFTLIAPHLRPWEVDRTAEGEPVVVREFSTFWNGDESGDEGEVRVIFATETTSARVEYAPVEKTYPTAATYTDPGELLAERERRAAEAAEYERAARTRREAEHARAHTDAEAAGLDGWADHLKNAHYGNSEFVKPSAIMATHERKHAEANDYNAVGPADARVTPEQLALLAEYENRVYTPDATPILPSLAEIERREAETV